MNISQADWQDASGSYVQDANGNLWQIIGFIDKPSVILDPVKRAGFPYDPAMDDRTRQVVVMGAPLSDDYRRLVLEPKP